MTSQKSQNKITMFSLMKEDLKHRKWMLFLSAFVQFLFGPVAALFVFSDMESRYYYYYGTDAGQNTYKAIQDAVERMTQSYLPVMMMVIAVVGAVIVGVGGYRHLFNRKMTDMVNSVPVTRGKQFDCIYINNWLIWFVPQLASTIITTLIILIRAASYGFAGAALKSAVFVLVGSALAFACVMNLVILAVTLSGTIINALLNAAFIGFDLIIAFTLVICLCQSFFYTFSDLPVSFSDVCWVSAPISGGYLGAIIAALPFDEGFEGIIYRFGSVSSFCLVLGLTVLIAIANIMIAYTLYIRRKSEESENGVSNKIYGFCIRCFNSALCGMAVAVLIDELFFYRRRYFDFWLIFFSVLFCVVTFGIIDMIQSRSAKGFFKHWKQMIAVVIATEIIFATFIFDLTGFDSRIIPESTIKSAEASSYIYGLGTSGSEYEKDPEHEGRLMETHEYNVSFEISPALAYRIITAEREIWDNDTSYLFDPLTGRKTKMTDDMWDRYSVNVSLRAERNTGVDFVRNYCVWDNEVIREIMERPGYMEKAYPFRAGELGYPRSIRVIRDFGYSSSKDIPLEYIEKVFDATVEDFRENYSVDYLEAWDSEYVYCLECEYEVTAPYGDDDSYYGTTLTMYLSEEDLRSIGLLDELGYDEYKWSWDPDQYEYY